MDRLTRTYGYPKDNAFPPPLCERLRDPHFVLALRHSIEDEDENASLLDALERLLEASDAAIM